MTFRDAMSIYILLDNIEDELLGLQHDASGKFGVGANDFNDALDMVSNAIKLASTL